MRPLPAEVFGEAARHTWPIRRIEAAVGDADVAAHAARELLKVGAVGGAGAGAGRQFVRGAVGGAGEAGVVAHAAR